MPRLTAWALAALLAVGGAATAQVAKGAPAVPERMSVAELRKRFGAPDDRYVTIDGVELRYRDEGKGSPVLLLHGSRSTLNAWDGVAAHLMRDHRVLRFDQPPTGLSGPLSDAAMKAVGSPEALVAKFLDAVHVRKATLFGTSSGGTLAYYVAGAYPDRVDALILSNTPSDPVPGLTPRPSAEMEAAAARVKAQGYEDRGFWQTYLSYLYGEQRRLNAAKIDYYYQTNLRVAEANPFGLHALTANKAQTMARLEAVRAPVLILWGMRDPVLMPASGRALSGYLRNAASLSFVALDTVGHYPPMESPDQVSAIVEAYLARDQ